MGINCALDGPSGAGKSTVAKAVAKELGFVYVDTGALYRAIGLYAARQGACTTSAQEVVPLLSDINVELKYNEGTQIVLLNGEDVSKAIRVNEISMAASNVSAIPEVRSFLLDLQRDIAAKNDIIMDGRDIGTVILPNADVKVFMTASAEERADRRYKELIEKGQDVTYDEILNDINQRDYNDSHRATAPLKKADDAIELDTSNMSIDEVVEAISNIIKEKTVKPVAPVEMKKVKWTLGLVLYAIVRFIVAIPVYICFNIKIEGKENIPHAGGMVVASNHRTWFDPIMIGMCIIKPGAYMAKEELFKNKLLGVLLKILQAFPVSRGSADRAPLDKAVDYVDRGFNLVLFPEGTRSKDGSLGKPKSGVAYVASISGAPVCPVGILFEGKLRFRSKITIRFGAPISPDEIKIEKMSAREMHKVRDRIYGAIGDLLK
ncbi:MAG: (d)CMP kinase [Oscillospiraceae bacterium]|nr:(d)CMP kinase [Oscillospiraceae bacterium]